jgi:hypothetical protein
MSNSPEASEPAANHIGEIEDGVGCTEIWERMNDIREDAAETREEL